MSLVISPCKKPRASGPATAMTARSSRWAMGMQKEVIRPSRLAKSFARLPREEARSTHFGMSETFDLLIRGGIVATPNGIAAGDVGVRGGRIAAIGSLSGAKAAEIFEA